jgi:hypothetical protein
LHDRRNGRRVAVLVTTRALEIPAWMRSWDDGALELEHIAHQFVAVLAAPAHFNPLVDNLLVLIFEGQALPLARTLREPANLT